jgi:hypothetical protein
LVRMGAVVDRPVGLGSAVTGGPLGKRPVSP